MTRLATLFAEMLGLACPKTEMTISPNPGSLPRLAITAVFVCLLSGCGGSSSSSAPAPAPNSLTAITIDPVNPSSAVGFTQQLHATGTYSDGTTKDLTASVTWSSTDSSVATVSNKSDSKGLATAGEAGLSTVTARLGGKQAQSAFTVTSATLTSIVVEPANPFLAKGTTLQLTATGKFSDGTTQDLTTQVGWSSANTNVASVSNSSNTIGLVAGIAAGGSAITASYKSVQGSTTVTVTASTLTSITITPPNPSIAQGSALRLTATGNFSDGTTQDLTSQTTWSSSNSAVAQISNTGTTIGQVTGASPGTATISAAAGAVQGSTTVTITTATLESISITPPSPSIAQGTRIQLTATGTFSDGSTQDLSAQVSWSSGDSSIVQVSNVAATVGIATGVTQGTGSIVATLNGVQGSTTVTVTAATLSSITITPPNPSIAQGTAVQLTATGNFSDGTTQDLTVHASWTSSNIAIAQVANAPNRQGLATGVAQGAATITATFGGVQGSASVTVTAATLSSITVTPPAPSLADGTALQLTATGNLSDGTTQDLTNQVSWTSASSSIASVSNAPPTQGLITGTSQGSSAITATLNGIQGSTTVTVTAATLSSITITPPTASLAQGTSVQLNATGTFSDGTTQDLTQQANWTAANSAVAQVSDTQATAGLVTGLLQGSTTINASYGGVRGSASVTVTPATLSSITITPPTPSIANGTTVQLMATGTFSDGTTQDLTAQANWTSATGTIAQVSNTPGSNGLVTGLSVGSTSITAAVSGVQGSTNLKVTAATLNSITVTPAAPSLADGAKVQLTATGSFSDGTNENLTRYVSWTSADKSIAHVSNALKGAGLVTALGQGSTAISAQLGGVKGSANVTVTAATLSSIAVTPANPSIAANSTVQLTATGTYSDHTTQDLTTQASWTSSNDTVAQVSNVTNSQGLVTGLTPGSASISATVNGVHGQTSVSVTAPVPTPTPTATVTPTATPTPSPIPDLIQFSPGNPQITPGAASTFTITISAVNSTGAPLTPSSTNPLTVMVYGSSAITVTNPTPIATSAVTFEYNGDAVPNNVAVDAWISDSTISGGGYAIGQTLILPQNPPCPASTQGQTYSVHLTSTVPNALQVKAAVGYPASAFSAKPTPTPGTYTVDTGSLGTIVTQSDLPDPNTITPVIGPGPVGTTCYDSDNQAFWGNYYLAPVDIKTTTGWIQTNPIMVLAVKYNCPVTSCSNVPTTPPCTSPGGLHYIGVGYDRESSSPTELFQSPAQNAFLQVTDANLGTDINQGYLLPAPPTKGNGDITLGINSTTGYNTYDLLADSEHPGDFQLISGSFTLQNSSTPFSGSGIFDIGIPEMLLKLPKSQWPKGTYESSSACTSGYQVPAGVPISVALGIPSPTSTSTPVLSYSFTTTRNSSRQKKPTPTPTPNPAAPSMVCWQDTTGTSLAGTPIVNTGRNPLQCDNYFYQGQCGVVGFQPVSPTPEGCPTPD